MTSTKEGGYLVLRESNKYYEPYDICARSPICFDLNNNLAFRCETPNFDYIINSNDNLDD